ncbi:MAG: Ig-like domain-containing protein [Calditrichota bacterium]
MKHFIGIILLLLLFALIEEAVAAASYQIRISGLQDSIAGYENRLWVDAFDINVCDAQGFPVAGANVRLELNENHLQTAMILPQTAPTGRAAGLLYGFIPEGTTKFELKVVVAEDSIIYPVRVTPRPGPDRIEILWADTAIWAETGQRAQGACRFHVSNYRGEPAAGVSVVFETLQGQGEILSEAWTFSNGDIDAMVIFPAEWSGRTILRATVTEQDPYAVDFSDTVVAANTPISLKPPAWNQKKGRLDLAAPIRKWGRRGWQALHSNPPTRLTFELNQTATIAMTVNRIASFSGRTGIPVGPSPTDKNVCPTQDSIEIKGLTLSLQIEPSEVLIDASSLELIALTAVVTDSAGNPANGVPVSFFGLRVMFTWWDSDQERFRYFYPEPPIRLTGEDGEGIAQVFLLGLSPVLFRDSNAQAMSLEITAQIGDENYDQRQKVTLVCRRKIVNASSKPTGGAD